MRERTLSLSALSSAFGLALLCVVLATSCAKGTSSTPTTCGNGLDLCGSTCVDLLSTAAHCGDCNTSCGAGQSCNGGSCSCVSPLTLCGNSCVDVNSDPNHCGGCTRPACAAGQSCSNGVCMAGCGAGLTSCGGGQCVDIQNSPLACGGCGKP